VSLSRRSVLRNAALALSSSAIGALPAPLVRSAAAQGNADAKWHHGLSLFGDLKYPAGFPHFDYVNAKAPKGGVVRMIAFGTFDNLNTVVSGVKGSIVSGIDLIYDTLMVQALDEISTEYGLLAEQVSYPDDYSRVVYRLRAEARWHDGNPVSVEDVIFSFDAFKKNSPFYAAYFRHVTKAEKTGEREVTFTFDGPGNRELPQIVGQLSVLPKHWWEGADSSGRKRDIGQTTLEKPLGCGAYRVKEISPGRSISFERVPDYWGAKLNVNVGRDNFDEMRFEYFRDSTVALEAFKADQVDWRTENSAKDWATAYDFPAKRDGRVVLEEFPIRNSGGMQAFAFNIRRDKFKDARVRRALNFAFDFEEMNKQIFFGQYKRIASYFEGTELASSGLPNGQELEILQPLRDKLPPEVFTTAYSNPVGGSNEKVRDNLRESLRLFKDADYEVRDRKMVNAKTGEHLVFEILLAQPTFERVALFWKPLLDRVGVGMSVRTVDVSQFENRLRAWDFDVVIGSWPESLSPGNEQREFWGSQAADSPGSRNLVGIKNEAIDALIERVIFAKDRAGLVAATRALDRALLWHHYVLPQWTYGKQRTARWDRFGKPQEMPKYGLAAFPTIWWWDAAKAAKVGSR
jgi:microcin C transport system substrate-binding protein